MKVKLKKKNYPGRLIVFEGTDGAGKSTMIDMAKEYLSERIGAENLIFVKQPTDISRKTKLFQKMIYCKNAADVNYRAMQLLTLSDRVQHGFEIIEPALEKGKTVICDRYIYTSVANMFARGYRKEKWFFSGGEKYFKARYRFLGRRGSLPCDQPYSRQTRRSHQASRRAASRKSVRRIFKYASGERFYTAANRFALRTGFREGKAGVRRPLQRLKGGKK